MELSFIGSRYVNAGDTISNILVLKNNSQVDITLEWLAFQFYGQVIGSSKCKFVFDESTQQKLLPVGSGSVTCPDPSQLDNGVCIFNQTPTPLGLCVTVKAGSSRKIKCEATIPMQAPESFHGNLVSILYHFHATASIIEFKAPPVAPKKKGRKSKKTKPLGPTLDHHPIFARREIVVRRRHPIFNHELQDHCEDALKVARPEELRYLLPRPLLAESRDSKHAYTPSRTPLSSLSGTVTVGGGSGIAPSPMTATPSRQVFSDAIHSSALVGGDFHSPIGRGDGAFPGEVVGSLGSEGVILQGDITSPMTPHVPVGSSKIVWNVTHVAMFFKATIAAEKTKLLHFSVISGTRVPLGGSGIVLQFSPLSPHPRYMTVSLVHFEEVDPRTLASSVDAMCSVESAQTKHSRVCFSKSISLDGNHKSKLVIPTPIELEPSFPLYVIPAPPKHKAPDVKMTDFAPIVSSYRLDVSIEFSVMGKTHSLCVHFPVQLVGKD
ncbi:hypothetical protein ADUPG1_012572 [Aduncisulcus paluster]|uniref:Uncharacterized protein n=1 Tax=Aduncisulcus paluster TaxID=2918883 RepID=A0ABQ5K4P6_9EUKA|nr:hypothetical protein ADUPG1_012572 [Aduncisulcus paluster]|eukprot:gnl/Carplike_NY0171/4294_a5821_381.p1 GENE.gnl/Carplike_NY0171/4294_a5821_381~~gnl/Carplike_NY0171/4294_a5821_381.p1  ORF type:complete len:493 (-),score=109.08 gnl/Carplike_NY0171/4294_a5821_381:174-1652(-)